MIYGMYSPLTKEELEAVNVLVEVLHPCHRNEPKYVTRMRAGSIVAALRRRGLAVVRNGEWKDLDDPHD